MSSTGLTAPEGLVGLDRTSMWEHLTGFVWRTVVNETSIHDDISFLTEGLDSPDERIRPTLEVALFRIGYTASEIDLALNSYYGGIRTLQ